MNKTRNPSEESSRQTTSSSRSTKLRLLRLASIALALTVWQVVGTLVEIDFLLSTPLDVITRLFELPSEEGFLGSVGFSLARISAGALLGVLAGFLLALLAGRLRAFEILLWPYVTVIKTVPVASFVVLALIWFRASNLSLLISFLMVLPIVYTNTLDGLRSVDKKMLELADVFEMPTSRRIRYIWLPALEPFFLSGVRVALSLAWKSGIAAELIGIPTGSIGESLYYSKLFLDTESLFAWTVVIVLLSVAFEKTVLFLLKYLFGRNYR